MQTVLITGGSGFIGSNLSRKLLLKGMRVISFDNNYTGRMSNINELLKNPNFTFVKGDVTQECDFKLLPKVDQIYNLACPASPPAYQGPHSIDTTLTCVLGAVNVLNFAKSCEARILQASTSEIYGDPTESPQIETYRGNVNPCGIRSCYDEGKRCAESLFFDYFRQEKVRIRVIRIFNTYGPFMDPNDGRVISNFICQALSGKDITVYGKGNQTRSFCYVDDLVDVMIKVMEIDDESVTGPFNTGNPQEFTIIELAKKVLSLINSSSKIIYKDLPQDDPKQRRPDINLVKKLTGWGPTTTLDAGLIKTIAYFKTQLHLFK